MVTDHSFVDESIKRIQVFKHCVARLNLKVIINHSARKNDFKRTYRRDFKL